MQGKRAIFTAKYLECGNIAQSARAAGVNESTAHRWLNNGLREEIQERQKALVSESVQGVQCAIGKATGYLQSLVEDENASPQERRRAAETILKYGLQAYEYNKLELLEKLEDEILQK